MPELPINQETRQTVRQLRKIRLVAGDNIKILKNNVEVIDYTMPQNKEFNGIIGVEGIVTNA